MRIAVVGLGAMGGLIAAKLIQANHEVCALARGETLAAVSRRGLVVEQDQAKNTYAIRASDQPEILGSQDLVIVSVKAPALPGLAASIARLRGQSGMVLTAMNGVPWWFFHGFGGPCGDLRLTSIDPHAALDTEIPRSANLGAVLHMSASTPEPAHVLHANGNRIILGEPGGGQSERLEHVCKMLNDAGFVAESSQRIQDDIWYKLWGNMTMNPVSAITGATIDKILDDPEVSRFCVSVMEEAKQLGERFGCHIEQSAQARNLLTRQLGAFKTSMLQDVEALRPVELDALLSVAQEIGRHLAFETPWINALLGLCRLRMQGLGLYPPMAGIGDQASKLKS